MYGFFLYKKFLLLQGSIGIVGFGYALVMVSTFGRTQAAALEKGFKDDIETYILISGNSICSNFLQYVLLMTDRS